MTNATDALLALPDQWDEFAAMCIEPATAHAIKTCASELRLRLATPAGSASGDVPFAVVGGVEFDSPQALCAAHAELQSELSDYRMAANAEAREVDRRGERINALQAEVAQLRGQVSERHCQVINSDAQVAEQRERAETAEAEAARLRVALTLAYSHLDMTALRVSHCKDAATIYTALESAGVADAAMGSANGQG